MYQFSKLCKVMGKYYLSSQLFCKSHPWMFTHIALRSCIVFCSTGLGILLHLGYCWGGSAMFKAWTFLMESNTLNEWEFLTNLGSSNLCNTEGKMSLYEWDCKWDSEKCEMIGYQPHFYKWSRKSVFFGDSYPRRTCICVFLLGPLQYMPEKKFPTLGKRPRRNLHTQKSLFFPLLYHHSEIQLISR